MCSRIRFRRVVGTPQSWGIAEWGAVPVLSQGDAARSSTEPRGGTRPQLTNVVRCANIHCLTQVASEGWGLVEESNRMFVQSFERGLEVIRSFNEECPRQSLSEVARRTGYSRASCRRLLFTLETLGYVGVDGREFFLQPRILDIGYSFLTSLPFRDIVEPFVQDLSDKVRESVSVSVLDGSDIVFVSRVAASRIMTLSLSVGSRLPAYCTSTGRVLLAAMPVAEQRRQLGSRPLVALTKFTLHRESDILTELEKVAKRGWALNDQELEIGLRAVAAPIRDSTGRTVAAINISTPVGRKNLKELREELVPQLLATTQRVNSILAKR